MLNVAVIITIFTGGKLLGDAGRKEWNISINTLVPQNKKT